MRGDRFAAPFGDVFGPVTRELRIAQRVAPLHPGVPVGFLLRTNRANRHVPASVNVSRVGVAGTVPATDQL